MSITQKQQSRRDIFMDMIPFYPMIKIINNEWNALKEREQKASRDAELNGGRKPRVNDD